MNDRTHAGGVGTKSTALAPSTVRGEFFCGREMKVGVGRSDFRQTVAEVALKPLRDHVPVTPCRAGLDLVFAFPAE